MGMPSERAVSGVMTSDATLDARGVAGSKGAAGSERRTVTVVVEPSAEVSTTPTDARPDWIASPAATRTPPSRSTRSDAASSGTPNARRVEMSYATTDSVTLYRCHREAQSPELSLSPAA